MGWWYVNPVFNCTITTAMLPFCKRPIKQILLECGQSAMKSSPILGAKVGEDTRCKEDWWSLCMHCNLSPLAQHSRCPRSYCRWHLALYDQYLKAQVQHHQHHRRQQGVYRLHINEKNITCLKRNSHHEAQLISTIPITYE